MKAVLKIVLRVVRAILFAGLLFSIYILYLHHKEGYQVVLYNMGEGYKIAWTTSPQLYSVGAEFCRGATALILAIPLLVAYWIVSLIIGDTIKLLSRKIVSDYGTKAEKIISADLMAQIRSENTSAVHRARREKETEGEELDVVEDKSIKNVPPKKVADASKTYVGAGALGRKLLDAKHAEAPDIYEEEVVDGGSVQ